MEKVKENLAVYNDTEFFSIQQTVEIPADRWVKIKVPREIPEGKTDVVIQFPVREKVQSDAAAEEKSKIHIPVNSEGKFILTKEVIEEMMQDSLLKKLTGILHTDMTIDEIRMARLAKHL